MEKNLNQIIKTYYSTPETSKNNLESDPLITDLDSYDWLFIRVKIRDLPLPDKEHNFFSKFADDQQIKKREKALIVFEESLNNKILKLKDSKKIEFCTLELSSISEEEERISIRIKQEQMGEHFLYEFESQMLYTHKKIIIVKRIDFLKDYLDIINQPFDGILQLSLQYYSISDWFTELDRKIKSWSKDQKQFYLIDLRSKINAIIHSTPERVFNIDYYKFNGLGDWHKIDTNYLESFITRLDFLIAEVHLISTTDKLRTNHSYNRFTTIFSALFLENEELQPVLIIKNLKAFLFNAFQFSNTPDPDYSDVEYSVVLLPKKGRELILRIGILINKGFIEKETHQYIEKWFNHHISNKRGLSIKNIDLNLSSTSITNELNKNKRYYKAVLKID